MKKKKKEKYVRNKSECSLRKRQGFRLLDPIGYQLPSCSHGSCLLFERRTQQTTEKFFACAVYRSQKRCSFRLNISSETTSSNLNSDVMNSHVHPIKGPFGITSLRRPSQLFSAHIRNDSESQYWFAEESLTVLVNAVEKSGCDGILCIGTPTIFEHFQSHKLLRQKTKSFLLDIDARFVPFFRSSHFAVYSMLTNHFYDPKSIQKIITFFGSIHRLIIICDPPFGVFVEALTNSIRQLREQFFTCSVGKLNDNWCRIIIVLPVFVGKRFLNCSDFHMLDYRNNTLMFKKPPQSFQVCYKNHSKYKRAENSIVRIFTDLPLNEFDLSELPDYRFCDKCEKFVIKTTLHCNFCEICPSEANTYKHCSKCGRCVKSTYKHCLLCDRCHLPQRWILLHKVLERKLSEEARDAANFLNLIEESFDPDTA